MKFGTRLEPISLNQGPDLVCLVNSTNVLLWRSLRSAKEVNLYREMSCLMFLEALSLWVLLP
jgi:hypothetical protein